MTRTIKVTLDTRSYPIHIGEGLLAQAEALLAEHIPKKRAIIVTDTNVAAHWLPALETALSTASIACPALTLPVGEATKSFHNLESLLEQLLALKPDRHTVLIALGGGVIGDITGFAASILLRGVPFIQIPTTLLAQVDSSVGGKTGINTAYGKNLIGSFYQPRAVLIDTATYATLPMRERKAGYAEIVKYGCIDQPDFFHWLEQHGRDVLAGETQALTHAIAVSCESKAAIVAEDEREAGKRALLNLGHTFGHALEAELGYDGRLLHGEAVAIGILMAFDLSVRLGLCPQADLDALRHHWQDCGLITSPQAISYDWQINALLAHMRQDKKVSNNTMTFILAHGLGQSFISQDVTESDVTSLLRDYI